MSWVATTKGIDTNFVEDLTMQTVDYRFGASQKAYREAESLTDSDLCYVASNTRSFAPALGFKPITTPAQSPHSNAMPESFVKTFKQGCVRLADRPDSATVMDRLKFLFEP